MRRHIDEQGMEIHLEVDGGIKVENIGVSAAAGATAFVSGSGILESADYGETIALMREQIRNARAYGGFDEAGRLYAPGG
jgi:ribulose-phosphate 3-epimerase